MQKSNQKSIILTTSIIALLLQVSNGLVLYGGSSRIKTVNFEVFGDFRIDSSNNIIVKVAETSPSRTAFYTFDVLASDFSSVVYQSRFDLTSGPITSNDMLVFTMHKDNSDIIIGGNERIYIFRRSTGQIFKKGANVENQFALGHLKGTNYFFTGTNLGRMSRYDITAASPMNWDASTNSLTSGTVRTVSLFDETAADNNDSAWSSDAPEVTFLDRTGDFSSFTRKFSHPSLTLPAHTYHVTTLKRLVVRQRSSGDNIFSLNYLANPVVTDYVQAPCGPGIGPNVISILKGTSKGFLACKSHLLLLVDLSDGTELKRVNAGFLAGRSMILFQEQSLLLYSARSQTGPSISKFMVWDIREETPCHSTCGTCDFDTSATGCTSCPAGKVQRSDGSCGDACLTTREYVDGASKCQACDPSCLTCSAGGTNGCLTCPLLKFKRMDNSCQDSCDFYELESAATLKSCVLCTRELCPRCQQNTLCFQCLSDPTLNGCPEIAEYSLSFETRGDEKRGDISIYLLIKLDSISIESPDLQFMIDYEFFFITASTLEFVGNASYDATTRKLLEKAKISKNSTRTIEYLVYQAPEIPESDKTYEVSLTLNNSILGYQQASATSTKPSLIIQSKRKSSKMVIPEVAGSQLAKAKISKFLRKSVSTTKTVGIITFVSSSLLLLNSLGLLTKFSQIIEFLINLSLVNSKLGILMERVINILRSLKFPIKLPSDLFWPEYEQAAVDLFWKSRFKISEHEKELFILCNETLVVILYLISWLIWLVMVGLAMACRQQQEESKIKSKELKNEGEARASPYQKTKMNKITPQGLRFRSRQGMIERGEIIRMRSIIGRQQDQMMDGLSKSIKESKNDQEEKIQQKEEKQADPDQSRDITPKKKSTLKFLESISRQIKEFLFNYALFDIQFIAFNELLHSDASKIDKLVSRASLSYFLSFICLILLNIDSLLIGGRIVNLVEKIKSGQNLTEIETEDQEAYFGDVKLNPEISKTALSFEIASMVRFAVYQLIVASIQLSPSLQTGSLLILQLGFYLYYLIKQAKEKFFNSSSTTVKFIVFETCILIFLLISFILSFENSLSWFSGSLLGYLQILAAFLIFLSLFGEFVTLVANSILNTIENIKSVYLFCQPKRQEKDEGKKEEKKGNEKAENEDRQTGRKLFERSLNYQNSRINKSSSKNQQMEGLFYRKTVETKIFIQESIQSKSPAQENLNPTSNRDPEVRWFGEQNKAFNFSFEESVDEGPDEDFKEGNN